MGNDLSEPSSLPYPDRRGWIIAAGVIEILMGLGSLLLAAFMALIPLKTPPPGHVQPPIAGVIMAVGIYVLIAAYFLVAGTGSVLRKNWARIMMLIGSGLWLVFGLIGTLVSVLMLPRMLEMRRAGPPGAHHLALAFTISFEVFLGILLPLGFLIFYTRKSIKQTFLAGSRTVAGEPAAAEAHFASFPIPVIILVVFEALGISTVLWMLAMPVTIAFGLLLQGWKAILAGLAISVFSGAAAWLMYKRRLSGWNIAFFKALLAGASMAVSVSSHKISELMARTPWKPQQAQMLQWYPHMMHAVIIGSTVWIGVYVLFLIYARKFFIPTPATESSPA